MIRIASYPIGRLFTSLAVGLALALALPATESKGFSPGQVVGFQDAAGKTFFLHDFKDRPVLINLWATWCGPCIAEMPSLDKLQKDYAGKGLAVLALSEDESLDAVLAFYREKKLPDLTPYIDKGHGVWLAVQTNGIPVTLLITRQGQMVQRIDGPVNWDAEQVRAMVDVVVK